MEQPTKHTSSQKQNKAKTLTVKVTPKNAKAIGHAVTSEATEKIDTLPTVKNISITGKVQVGKTLAVTLRIFRCG